MSKYVCSYVDPDLDGVACSILLAAMSGDPWRAIVLGKPDAETRNCLQHLGLSTPPAFDTLPDDAVSVKLVDTHNLAQLPAGFPTDRVVEVIDHHPDGDPAAFSRAEIVNERVGAAASLLVERFMRAGPLHDADKGLLRLAQAAIWSNTQGLGGPATHERDHQCMQALAEVVGNLPDDLTEAMAQARRDVLRQPTPDLLLADVKLFSFGDRTVAVSQVEAEGASEDARRSDIREILAKDFLQATGAAEGIASFVDTGAARTVIYCTNDKLEADLAVVLEGDRHELGALEVGRVCLRKTDLIPALDRLLPSA